MGITSLIAGSYAAYGLGSMAKNAHQLYTVGTISKRNGTTSRMQTLTVRKPGHMYAIQTETHVKHLGPIVIKDMPFLKTLPINPMDMVTLPVKPVYSTELFLHDFKVDDAKNTPINRLMFNGGVLKQFTSENDFVMFCEKFNVDAKSFIGKNVLVYEKEIRVDDKLHCLMGLSSNTQRMEYEIVAHMSKQQFIKEVVVHNQLPFIAIAAGVALLGIL